MGFASSPATVDALAPYGIRVSGYRWRWGLGLKGGTFPPHRAQNGQVRSYAHDFDAEPGEDVNGSSCMCALVPAYRDANGRLAKPGLAPVFQPPVAGALNVYRPPEIDMHPLINALRELAEQPPQQVILNVPKDAITVRVDLSDMPTPNVLVEGPRVNVEAPNVTVQPQIDVQPPAVTVEAPVTVEPATVNVDVKPSPVKIIRERVGSKRVKFRRNSDGQISSAEVEPE